MLWFVFALATALSVAFQDSLAKRLFGGGSPARMLGFVLLYSLPWVVLGWSLVERPPLGPEFFWGSALLLPLNGVAMLLYMRAIKLSPLSLTMPILAFSPAFLIFIGWVVLGEVLSWWGIFGVLVIMSGGYLLHLDRDQTSLWSPFGSLWADPGSRAMLGASLLFAFAAALGKFSLSHASPLYFAFSFFTVHNLLILIVLRAFGQISLRDLLSYWKSGVWVGGLYACQVVFHHLAVALTQTAYMISVKRLNMVFSVGLGRWVFKEENTGQRLLASLLMLAGVAVIYLLG
ncbi:MAG: DMT family transporter [bacterium]|nr:DMT family transporter [bacterium]